MNDHMDEAFSGFGIAVVIVVILFIAGYAIAGCVHSVELKRQAIQHGFAEYNNANGQWQWITNESATINQK